MRYIIKKNDKRNVCIPSDNEYTTFIDIVLKHSDTVCFVVYPYLDSIEELNEDTRYADISESFIKMDYIDSIHTNGNKDCVAYFKKDYWIRKFLMERSDIFDFYEENAAINLEDVTFLKNNEIICDTLTHEEYCAVIKEIEIEFKSKI